MIMRSRRTNVSTNEPMRNNWNNSRVPVKNRFNKDNLPRQNFDYMVFVLNFYLHPAKLSIDIIVSYTLDDLNK